MKDKRNTDMSYWTLYVWRSHPVVKGLTDIYREIHQLPQPESPKLKESGFRLSSTDNGNEFMNGIVCLLRLLVLHKSGYIQDFRISEFNSNSGLPQQSPKYYAFDHTVSTLGSTLGATIQVERGVNKLSTSRTFFGHEQEAK